MASAFSGCRLSHKLCLIREFQVDIIQFSCSFSLLPNKEQDTSAYVAATFLLFFLAHKFRCSLLPLRNSRASRFSLFQIYYFQNIPKESLYQTQPESLVNTFLMTPHLVEWTFCKCFVLHTNNTFNTNF